jgi:hypothetical protein
MNLTMLAAALKRRMNAAPGYQFLTWPSDGAAARWPSDNKKIQVTRPVSS